MYPEHQVELDAIRRTPVQKIIYALGMLADVVDGNMVGDERDIHVQDAREVIAGAIQELRGGDSW